MIHADISVLSDEHAKTEEEEEQPGTMSYWAQAESAEVCRCKMPLKCCMNILKDKNQCKVFQSHILS